MKDLSPIPKIPESILHLDFVLTFLATSPIRKEGLSFEQILPRVTPTIEDGSELKRMLKKLTEDKYVDPETNGSYSINIRGEYFHSLDGYGGEILRVHVHHFIRGDMKLDGLEALKSQLGKDKVDCLKVLV